MKQKFENISRFSAEFLDEYSLSKEFNIGYELLMKNGLLTPHLIETFGEVSVSEAACKERIETEKAYLRQSVISQVSTGIILLEAQLHIVKEVVPVDLINDLKLTSIPFGSLLGIHGQDVVTKDKHIILQKRIENDEIRIGRSHKIVNAKGALICFVNELMASEMLLSEALKNNEKMLFKNERNV